MVNFEPSAPWGVGKLFLLMALELILGVGTYFALILTGEMILLLIFAVICICVGLTFRALINIWIQSAPRRVYVKPDADD